MLELECFQIVCPADYGLLILIDHVMNEFLQVILFKVFIDLPFADLLRCWLDMVV